MVALNSSTTGTKRPLLVWLITIFSGLAIVFTLASFVLVYSGRVPLNRVFLAQLAQLSQLV